MLPASLFVATLAVTPAPLPAFRRLGDGWGTNIHFLVEDVAGEAAMLSQAYKLARMDLHWSNVERVCGEYNFTAYDGLLATMATHSVRPVYVTPPSRFFSVVLSSVRPRRAFAIVPHLHSFGGTQAVLDLGLQQSNVLPSHAARRAQLHDAGRLQRHLPDTAAPPVL